MPKATAEFTEHKLYKGKVTVKFYPGNHSYWVDGKRMLGATTIIGIKDKSGGLVPWAVGLAEQHLIDLLEKRAITLDDVLEACGLHEVRKKEAADIGSLIHDWIESYIKHKLKDPEHKKTPAMPDNDNVATAVNAFLDWEREHKVKFISSERLVYSRKYGYMGTLDIEAIVDGDLCLVDIKSSNDIRNEYRMQTAAYVRADEEESGRKYIGRWIVRVAKETEKEYIERFKVKQQKDIRKGRDARPIPPYQAFEAKYLDSDKSFMERDFEAFRHCQGLHAWNKATDPYLGGVA